MLTWTDCDGNIVSQSQGKILQAMSCSIDESASEPWDNHFDLVGKAVKILSSERKSLGGVLGNKASVKYRIVATLEKYLADIASSGSLVSQEHIMQVKLAINDIYNYPIFDNSKYLLNQMLKTSQPSEIAEAVLEMRKNGNLCKIIDGVSPLRKQASVICSMGLKSE